MIIDNEYPHTTGYTYTHFDCPECGHAMEAEGDVKNEVFTCEECEKEFVVT